jgi:hypothetical protein
MCKCKKHNNNKNKKKTKNQYVAEYNLCSDRLVIIDNTFEELLYFPWFVDKNKNMSNGKITFGAKIDDTSWFEVQVFNSTTSTIIGSSTIIKSSGIHRFKFNIPSINSQLTIMFKKIDGNGADPQVWGLLLNYKYKI